MDRVIKFRYTCVKPLSTFHEFFTIEKIERGDAKTWMDMNVVLIGQLHRDRFTGLLDKNGTEIYEGDILKYSYAKDTQTIETFTEEVEWDDMENFSGFTIHKSMTHEVVGNIHTSTQGVETTTN